VNKYGIYYYKYEGLNNDMIDMIRFDEILDDSEV